MSSLTRSPLWAERLSITTTRPLRRVGPRTCSTYVSKTWLLVAPSTASEGPIPSMVMVANSVVLLQRLRGKEKRALSPFLEQPYRGESEVLVPISSTKTRERASRAPDTITFQAALRHSSRSSAPTVLFSREAHPL